MKRIFKIQFMRILMPVGPCVHKFPDPNMFVSQMRRGCWLCWSCQKLQRRSTPCWMGGLSE